MQYNGFIEVTFGEYGRYVDAKQMDKDTYPGEVIDGYFIMGGNYFDAPYDSIISNGDYARVYPIAAIQKCYSAYDLSEYGFYKSVNSPFGNLWINNHADPIIRAFNP